MPSVSEAFETPEYFTFKEYLSKASVDNSIKVKNGYVVYGKSVKEVPPFRSIEYVKSRLNDKKVKLLLQLNDIYDKIVVSSNPELHKVSYDTLVNTIELIDAKIDEIDAFIQHQNQMTVIEPIQKVEQEIENNKIKADSIIKGVSEDVHVDKSKIKSLLSIHKTNTNLFQKLTEAKAVCEMDYVIWPEAKPKEVRKSSKTSAILSTVGIGDKSARKTRISSVQKQSIKNNVKQLMIERL
jgi:hypothetical protein